MSITSVSPENLKSALGQYFQSDCGHAGIDEAVAVAVMMEKYEIVRDMFAPGTKGENGRWKSLPR